ncbi:PREDICTED: monothiol glutaredoxin-S6 [Tarenaya hassleriana]|uniref:monothiol glutaredoxin-S6 n=1 Tax=Tarenaya hassleriana TaxID=28532 RepID=UPI00053C3A99|nr:PREDICTED: monothiol glutaredoxin-S6 [Tarenaya hassleriana]
MESIRGLVAEKPVVVFSRSSCCMSHSIQSLISGYGANVTVYELDQMSNGQEIEKALSSQLGCKPTVPAVFIAQQLVGGANQVMSLQVKNQLAPLLRKAGAIWI